MQTPTILIVDDDATNRSMLARLLEMRGFRICTSGDGPEALRLIESERPHLVLLDRTLPMMDGRDVLREIRLCYSPGELPVIMVTGNGESDVVVEAFELGANDLISKPVDLPGPKATSRRAGGRCWDTTARREADARRLVQPRASGRHRPAARHAGRASRGRTLENLRALGFRLSIDDFGTGQSSLSYVHRLPVNRLKFDRSFFAREKGARETDAVMRTIVELGRRLGIAVVAEGVETEADLARVRSLGCELAQGYLFAKPGSADSVPSLVRTCAVPDLNRARALA